VKQLFPLQTGKRPREQRRIMTPFNGNSVTVIDESVARRGLSPAGRKAQISIAYGTFAIAGRSRARRADRLS
jgi:hypothetical protein